LGCLGAPIHQIRDLQVVGSKARRVENPYDEPNRPPIHNVRGRLVQPREPNQKKALLYLRRAFFIAYFQFENPISASRKLALF
jgi:hypothetical protein